MSWFHLRCCCSATANLENQQWPWDWKIIFIPTQKELLKISKVTAIHLTHWQVKNSQAETSTLSLFQDVQLNLKERCFLRESNCQHPRIIQKARVEKQLYSSID